MIGRFIQETYSLFEQEKYQNIYELCNQELVNYENIGREYTDEECYYIATIYSTMAHVLEGKDALECLNQAISFVPNSASLYYQRADIKKLTQDFKGAIADYSVIIDNAPSHEAYISRATARFCIKDFKGVITDCNKALEISPDYIHAYGVRGEAKICLKDYNSALEDFRTILTIEPENNGAKRALSDLRKELLL